MSRGRNLQTEGSAKQRPEVRAGSASWHFGNPSPGSRRAGWAPGTCVPNQPHPGNKLLAGEGGGNAFLWTELAASADRLEGGVLAQTPYPSPLYPPACVHLHAPLLPPPIP